MNRRTAFTLVEVLATLVIVGLFAGTVAAFASGSHQRSAGRRAVSTILIVDAQARAHAKRSGRACAIAIDAETGRVGIETDKETRWRSLPTGLETIDVDVFAADANDRDIRIDQDGAGTTYRFVVRGRHGETDQSVLVTSAGIPVFLEPGDRIDVESILSARPDAR